MNFDPIYSAGIQKCINEKAKQRLTPDGQFGPKSQAALKVLQSQNGLRQTGLFDEPTFAMFDPFIKQKYLTWPSIERAAADIALSKAHIRTVCDVESKGSGYLPDGRVKILFERHHFIKSLRARLPQAQVEAFQARNPDIISDQVGGYAGNEAEWDRFIRAAAIDQFSAYYATSWGLFQIMGFNFKMAGYTDLIQYGKAMMESESNQLDAFIQFLKVYRSGICWNALKANNWAAFALNYNGSNYRANEYDTKLADSFKKYTKDIFAY